MRESMIFTFNTELDKTRTLNLPNPKPALDAVDIGIAVNRILDSGAFDSDSDKLKLLRKAVREEVETSVLFS